MPRFHVVFADPTDNSVCGYIARIDNPSDAICNHPWIREIYNNQWVAKFVHDEDSGVCIDNILNVLGWLALCVNLDEEIMNALNAGDSSASLATPQS
jgi:hypothetical protein